MKQSPMYLGLIFLFLFGILCASPLEGESQRNSYWVFFSDKGIESASPHRALNEARSKLNPHARWRRAKVLPNLVDELDLPVSQAHLAEVSA
ncbi:MAG: hypothetical protein FJY66_06470, partial [Calditrichaeota bacterium]|nr:hypothetical protein [Calditrichota bacterium]